MWMKQAVPFPQHIRARFSCERHGMKREEKRLNEKKGWCFRRVLQSLALRQMG
jgi:hypothetical protein